ncbi:MAG: alkaline phosphatase D family protein [Pseudomonadota bacterium]
MQVSRRHALLGGLAGSLGACASQPKLGSFQGARQSADAAFSCGVASGDPAQDSVVLWTRVSEVEGSLAVTAEVSSAASFERVVFSSRMTTGAERDYTVKVVATGLEPGQTYFYRFRAGHKVSPIGRTKTLPETTERVRFAVVSCSNYPFGHFNAYDLIARDDELDAVLHLGDYIYEYGTDGYGGAKGKALGRDHTPAHECLMLGDYRQRHRQYKADAASRAMHSAHPMIAIWDDHETSNDAWQRGAENHQPATEGGFNARKRAALQAYYEYMPVRDPQAGRPREQLYREFQWGKFLTLTAIETRLTARTEQIDHLAAVAELNSDADVRRFRTAVLNDPSRELLGDAQQAFVAGSLARSVQAGAPWRVLSNQILMARVMAPNIGAYVSDEAIAEIEKLFPDARAFLQWSTLGLPYNPDAWDGYPAARERFYEAAKVAGARDLLVLTGDTHMFWANDLRREDGTEMGVELGTAGVTSPGANAVFGENAFDYSLLVRKENKDVRYVDGVNNGYIRLDLYGDAGQADFISMSTIDSPDYTAVRTASFGLRHKDGTLELARSEGLGFKEKILYR